MIMFFLFLSLALVDPATMAYLQKESSVLAASCTRDKWRDQPEATGKSQEEEAQITQPCPCSAISTSFQKKILVCFTLTHSATTFITVFSVSNATCNTCVQIINI